MNTLRLLLDIRDNGIDVYLTGRGNYMLHYNILLKYKL
jgi:hypothetical protein